MKLLLKSLCLCWLVVLSACTNGSQSNVINLANLQPLPAQNNRQDVIRISVAAVVSPQGTLDSYQPLINYLSEQLNRPVELVQRRTYAETNDLIRRGEVDIAFVCTNAYITGNSEFGMQLLVAPQVNNSATYQALLIVPKDSPAQSMADLQNKRFAFTDANSFTGRIYPTYILEQMGTTPDNFFESTFFAYSHDNAIRAVEEQIADGASVDSLVYQFAVQRDPTLAQRVKIIDESPLFAIPPVVVSPDIDPGLGDKLQNTLLTMHTTPEGRIALQTLGIDRFVILDDSDYDSIRVILEEMP